MITLSRTSRVQAMPFPTLLAERTGLLSLAMSCRQPAQVHAYAASIEVLNTEIRLRGRQAGHRRVKGL